jgi:hypothetical protein
MRRWLAVCIDRKTNMEIVLSECGYNEACFFLETHGAEVVSAKGNRIVCTNGTVFVYDDERSMLLKERS